MSITLLLLITITARANDVRWEPLEQHSSSSGITVSGRVVPREGALNIESARVPGRALAILRHEGERVTIGQELFEISSAECVQLQEERRVATSKKLDELIAGVELRERQLGLKLRGGRCFAVATHAGILTKRNIESGASFALGDALATILDVHQLTIEVDVPERDQPHVAKGQAISYQFATDPEATFRGKIENIVPTIDPVTRVSKARVKPDGKIPAGISLDQLVFGEIQTGGQLLSFRAPASALVFAQDKQFVIKGPAAHPVAVEVHVLSETNGVSAVRPVKEGQLAAGDQIATAGAIFLLKTLTRVGPAEGG